MVSPVLHGEQYWKDQKKQRDYMLQTLENGAKEVLIGEPITFELLRKAFMKCTASREGKIGQAA